MPNLRLSETQERVSYSAETLHMKDPGGCGNTPGARPNLDERSDMAQCSIPDCPKPVRARSWCSVHYQRWAKYSSPYQTKIIVGDEVARFWSHVDQNGPDGCWLWTGGLNEGGYAQFRPAGKPKVGAHRYAYELVIGLIPSGMDVDHVAERGCRHRHCVNPAHLEPVTPKENVRRVPHHWATVNARKMHCVRDHEFTPANTIQRSNGSRECRSCKRERAKASR